MAKESLKKVISAEEKTEVTVESRLREQFEIVARSEKMTSQQLHNIIKLMQEHNLDINTLVHVEAESDGINILHLTAAFGNAAMVRALLEIGADASIPTSNIGATALMLAVSNDNAPLAELQERVTLLATDKNTDINFVDTKGCNALMYAVSYGSKDSAIVKILCDYSINITCRDNYDCSPLIAAICNHNISSALYLIESTDAYSNTKGEEYRAALADAALYNCNTVIEALKSKGQINDVSETTQDVAQWVPGLPSHIDNLEYAVSVSGETPSSHEEAKGDDGI